MPALCEWIVCVLGFYDLVFFVIIIEEFFIFHRVFDVDLVRVAELVADIRW